MSYGHLCEDIPECPLCLEPFALDDVNFYPCSCRYQICRFCWHRIRTDENGLCPHCREPYSENPAEYTPPSQVQLVKLKHDKKQKTHDKKQKLVESRKSLSSLRVVQKNLVFVIGLSPRLAEADILRKNEYFGKYGKIYKVVINNSTVYNGAQGPSVSAYVTYYREEDASKAIQAVNNAFIDGRHLKASYGTTKYCTYFLRGSQCTKPDCMYLHEMGNEEASFTKEDMQAGKHQVFETQTLAASSTAPGGREQGGQGGQGGQSSSKKQEALLKGKDIDGESSALPATASWATRQAAGLLPLPPMKEAKSHSHSGKESSKHSKSHKSQKHSSHSHIKSSGPLSPHSILGPGPGGSESGTARRHNSTGSRSERSNTRSNSVTRSNSMVASGSSKSVSPNLSPQSSLSTSSSSGSLKQDLEARDGGIGGGGGGKERKNSEKEESRDVEFAVPGKPHPLEAVSRQLDPIDIDDDWGLQEVRATTDIIVNTTDTVATATDTANTVEQLADTGDSMDVRRGSADREREKERGTDAVDVISSLGSAATGQFGSLGVSWNSGAPPLATSSPPPPAPSQYPVPGDQETTLAPRRLERNQTPDDDLGFDPWDVSTRGLADLLETEKKPSQAQAHSRPLVNGEGGRGGGGGRGISAIPTSTVTMETASNLSWQDELKTVFPNVNISFGNSWPNMATNPPPSSSTSLPTPHSTPLTTTPAAPFHPSSSSSASSSSSTPSQQTPLQQAINGATQSMSFPYHQAGVSGMGSLFGYSSSLAPNDYRSLYEEAQSSSRATSAVTARSAFEAPKLAASTVGTSSTSTAASSSSIGSAVGSAIGSTSAVSNSLTSASFPSQSMSNSIDWPDLSTSASAIGSKRTGKTSGSSSGSIGGGVVNSSVATWNGSMGNGGVGNGATKAPGIVSTANGTAASKESSGGAIAPPPGFTTRANKDTSLSSSVNHALWNNAVGKGQAGVATQANPAMTNQILQNWAKYLQMNFGGLTAQQLAANPLYQQMVRQQQQYWAMLRQQQLLQLQQAGVTVAASGRGTVLTPAQIQQLQGRMALSQAALNQATVQARLQQQQQQLQQTLQQSQAHQQQQQQQLQQTLQQSQAHQQQQQQARNSLGQQQQQQARNSLGQQQQQQVGVPATAIPVSGSSILAASLGQQAVRLGQPHGALLTSSTQSSSSSNRPLQSQKVSMK